MWMLLLACKRFEVADDLTSPVVMQGLFLGMNLPDGVQLGSGNEEDEGAFAFTAVCEVFVAYLTGKDSLVDSPVAGAALEFEADAIGKNLQFVESEPGKYGVDSTDGLVYEPGDRAKVWADVEGGMNRVMVTTPDAPDYSIPASVPQFTDVEIDLSDYDYDNMIVGAYNLDLGKIMWDNLPTAFGDVYDFTHPNKPIEAVTIPGDEAFYRRGTYIIGVAGMDIAPVEGFEGVNTTLSAFMAGRISLRFMTVE